MLLLIYIVFIKGDYMLKGLIDIFKNLDKLTYKIMIYGFKFCFFVCLLSILILVTYNLNILSPFMYYIGINLFEISIIFSIEFVICGLVVDGIKKQLI